MTLRVAIQMDPVASVNFASDTTLLLGIEACRRDYEVWHYTPDTLSCRDGKITAKASRTRFFDDAKRYYESEEISALDLKAMDVVLLRQDPPFDMHYITTTYLLEMLLPKPLVFNHPASVRNLPEKLFPVQFRQFMPPTLITSNAGDIRDFANEYRDVVIKPFYGFGGHSIFRTGTQDNNFEALLETLLAGKSDPVVVQKFLPEVASGDRRIVMIDGKVSGAIGRIPAENEIRANLRVGGTSAKVELTRRQHEICEALGPVLKENGLLLAGVDVIGDWLTEINITSPTGLRAINRHYGVQLEREFWDAVESYLP